MIEVIQADREAAADFFECSTFAGRDAFLRGDEDSSDVVQAFAKHRQATEARAQGLVDALRPFADCCDQIADDESDEEWAKFRLLIKDYRAARQALATWRRT